MRRSLTTPRGALRVFAGAWVQRGAQFSIFVTVVRESPWSGTETAGGHGPPTILKLGRARNAVLKLDQVFAILKLEHPGDTILYKCLVSRFGFLIFFPEIPD